MIDDGCDFFHSCQRYQFLWDSTAFLPPAPLMYCHCVCIAFVLLQFLYCLISFLIVSDRVSIAYAILYMIYNRNNFARYRSQTKNSLS